MFLISSCSCHCPKHWSQVLRRERRCGWSSADRRCSNYIWVINNFIAYWGMTYIRGLTVIFKFYGISCKWSLQNFAHGMTAILSWHVLNLYSGMITYNRVTLKLNRGGEMVREMGPWSVDHSILANVGPVPGHYEEMVSISRGRGPWLNTLRPRQNGLEFPDDIFKWISLYENI